MKREIIFEMPKTYGDYRMKCRFGYDYVVYYAWWGHLEKKIYRRKWLGIFGKLKEVWIEVDKCWWSFDIKTIQDLKKAAAKFYDERVEMEKRICQQAINL